MDEAQDVGEGHSAVSQFAARLDAKHRWAVTGTPIGPNGLADIAGLLKTIAHPLALQLPSLRKLPCDSLQRNIKIESALEASKPVLMVHSSCLEPSFDLQVWALQFWGGSISLQSWSGLSGEY